MATVHEMKLNDLLKRSVTGTDRWHQQHTTWLWNAQIYSATHQCSCEFWNTFCEVARDANNEICKPLQCCAGIALGLSVPRNVGRSLLGQALLDSYCQQHRSAALRPSCQEIVDGTARGLFNRNVLQANKA